MSHKIVVGYDGSDSAKAALAFATNLARAQGGSIVVAHVLEWSPYSFLTPTELEERHKRRGEELARAEAAILKPAVDSLKDSGIEISTALKYGHTAATLGTIAKDEGADQIGAEKRDRVGKGANGDHDRPGADVPEFEKPCEPKDVEHPEGAEEQACQHQEAEVAALLEGGVDGHGLAEGQQGFQFQHHHRECHEQHGHRHRKQQRPAVMAKCGDHTPASKR